VWPPPPSKRSPRYQGAEQSCSENPEKPDDPIISPALIIRGWGPGYDSPRRRSGQAAYRNEMICDNWAPAHMPFMRSLPRENKNLRMYLRLLPKNNSCKWTHHSRHETPVRRNFSIVFIDQIGPNKGRKKHHAPKNFRATKEGVATVALQM